MKETIIKEFKYCLIILCFIISSVIVSATLPPEGSVDDGRNVTFINCDDPSTWDPVWVANGFNIFHCEGYNTDIDLRIFSRDVSEGFEALQPRMAAWDDDQTGGGCSVCKIWTENTGTCDARYLFDTVEDYYNTKYATKAELEELHLRLDALMASNPLEAACITANRTGVSQEYDGWTCYPDGVILG